MAEKQPRTILLVFIHGFKGDDTTFARFPTGVSHALSSHLSPDDKVREDAEGFEAEEVHDDGEEAKYRVIPIVYPAFETRGSLQATVERFRAWLLEKVIDAEVARETPHPTVEPGVGVVLVGHSMGGIVAAEACLGIVRECFNVPADEGASGEKHKDEAKDAEEILLEAQQVPVPEEDDPKKQAEEEAESDSQKTWEQAEVERAAAVAAEQDNAVGVEEEASARKQKQDAEDLNVRGHMFPKILGVLAFDTPYLGIAPGVVRHNAEEQYKTGKQWYDNASTLFAAGSTVSNMLGLGKAKEQAAAAEMAKNTAKKTSWGRTALYAGAGITALAGAGAAAYTNKDAIIGQFNWVSSHLEFVGCLAREADLKKRFGEMVGLTVPSDNKLAGADATEEKSEEKGEINRKETIGFKVLYSLLAPVMGGDTSTFAGGRTFCQTPKDKNWQAYWMRAMNDKANNEINAHTQMFTPKENSQYEPLVETSASTMAVWIEKWA